MRPPGMARKTTDLSLRETASEGAAPLRRVEFVAMELGLENKSALKQVATNPETPAGTEVSSPGTTLHLISKTESATLVNTELMEEAGCRLTSYCDPNSTNFGDVENTVQLGGTCLEEPVADRLDARVAIGFRLILVATVVVSLAFVAGIWLGRESAHLRSVVPATRFSMKRASAAVTPKSSPTRFSASAAAPPNHEPNSTSDQVRLLEVTPEKLSKLPRVTGIQYGSTADSTDIVVDLEDQVQYEAHRLPNPDRIFFDLYNTQLAPELVGKAIRIGDMSVNRIRIAQPVIGTTRIVLETKLTSDFAVKLEANPSRLVIHVHNIEQSSGRSRRRNDFTKPVEISDAQSSKVADPH